MYLTITYVDIYLYAFLTIDLINLSFILLHQNKLNCEDRFAKYDAPNKMFCRL